MSGQYGPDALGEGGSEVTWDNFGIREKVRGEGEGALPMGLTLLILYLQPHHTYGKK